MSLNTKKNHGDMVAKQAWQPLRGLPLPSARDDVRGLQLQTWGCASRAAGLSTHSAESAWV